MDQETRTYLDRKFKAVDEQFTSVDKRFDVVDEKFDTVDRRFDAVDEKFVEMRRHFDVVAEDSNSKIQLVSEGYDVVRREMQEFREEVQTGFRELQSLIKFSYAELDRRIRTLEEDLFALRARVEQLEKRTH